MELETTAAAGTLAGSGIVFGILVVIKPYLMRWLSPDAIPIAAVALGVGWAMLAWRGGLLEAQNVIAAIFMGVTVGLAASGLHGVQRHYRG
jgi:hypothetical protein